MPALFHSPSSSLQCHTSFNLHTLHPADAYRLNPPCIAVVFKYLGLRNPTPIFLTEFHSDPPMNEYLLQSAVQLAQVLEDVVDSSVANARVSDLLPVSRTTEKGEGKTGAGRKKRRHIAFRLQ
jgi:hypothetical protein